MIHFRNIRGSKIYEIGSGDEIGDIGVNLAAVFERIALPGMRSL